MRSSQQAHAAGEWLQPGECGDSLLSRDSRGIRHRQRRQYDCRPCVAVQERKNECRVFICRLVCGQEHKPSASMRGEGLNAEMNRTLGL